MTLITAAMIVQGLAVLPAAAQVPGNERVTVLADGLDSPRGVAVDADGAVYVAESGIGGDQCVTEEDQDETGATVEVETCFGLSGNVLRVDPDGTVEREFVTDLPSLFRNGEAIGPTDVSIGSDGDVYVVVGLGASAAVRAEAVAGWGAEAAKLGTLLRVEEDGSTVVVADLAEWEAENDPDGMDDSNPHGVLAMDDVVYVADAGGNSVLGVDPTTGEITLETFSEPRTVQTPPFFPGPPEILMQSVPTSVLQSPEGEILFTELTGFPFPIGGANVLRLTDSQTPEVVASEFTNLMDATYRNGDLFALELAHQGLLASRDMAGALVRVRENATRVSLLRDVLRTPGGIASNDDGILYISNSTITPGTGSLLAFDPSQAADPAVSFACPPDLVAGELLSDIGGNAHEEAIHCMGWYDVFTGFADGTFGPHASITRGQFAATLARLVRASGTELPAADADAFTDVSGTTHAADIGALASAEIVAGFADGAFRPNEPISRAQAATIMVGAYTLITGDVPPVGDDSFVDDDGSVHEESIDRAAAAGWINGVGADMFAPGRAISRGQTASVLARVASTLVEDGDMTLPSS